MLASRPCEVAQADGWVTAGRDLIEAGLNPQSFRQERSHANS
jgi:hypothetical protein